MKRKLITISLLLMAAALAYAYLRLRPADAASARTLTVYCAASLKQPVEAIAAQYQKELGITIALQYGGSGTLLTQLRGANRGDLFIAADEGSITEARRLNVIQEVLPLAIQHPVIAVAKGNPKGIHTLADLERADIRLALSNPEAASIGKVCQKLLGARWDSLARKAAVMKPTVTEVAADTQLGAVDAALVWDSILQQFKGLDSISLPELSHHEEKVSVAVLTTAASASEALNLARYLTDPSKGGLILKQQGLQPAVSP